MNLPDATYNRQDIKLLRNKKAEAVLVPAIHTTGLLHGTNAYVRAVKNALGEHGMVIATLLRDGDEPGLVIPLAWLYAPSRDDNRTIPGGMLVTLKDRAVFAWQQFREGRSGSLGMCDICVRTIAYVDVKEAEAQKALISVTTTDRFCQFIPLNFLDKHKRQPLYTLSIVAYVVNSFLSASPADS